MEEPASPRTPLTARALNGVNGASDESTPRTTKKERKKLKKAAKAMERDKVITSADIIFVANTLHSEVEREDEEKGGTDLVDEKNILLNLKFNNSVCNTKTARQDFIKKDQIEDAEDSKAEVGRLLEIFEMDTKATGREGKLVAELGTAIQNDLARYHDELNTTAKFRDAFWRWANVKAYRERIDNGKDWDEHTPCKQRSDSIENLDDGSKTAAADSDTEAKSEQTGSVDSSVSAASASTAITIPSVESSPTKKTKPKILNVIVPPLSNEPILDPGWKQVGKKTLKPPSAVAKLKMVKNGGLHHLAQSPKSPYASATSANSVFACLAIDEPSIETPKLRALNMIGPPQIEEPTDDPDWKKFGMKVLMDPVKELKLKKKVMDVVVSPKIEQDTEDSSWEHVAKKGLNSPVASKIKTDKNGDSAGWTKDGESA